MNHAFFWRGFFMHMKKIVLPIVLFFAFANALFAQTKVSGIVVDNTNEPIPYANIVFKGAKMGVVSNEDGRFYIESPENYTAIMVSFVGFPYERSSVAKTG